MQVVLRLVDASAAGRRGQSWGQAPSCAEVPRGRPPRGETFVGCWRSTRSSGWRASRPAPGVPRRTSRAGTRICSMGPLAGVSWLRGAWVNF
jgi:hypothetical protein